MSKRSLFRISLIILVIFVVCLVGVYLLKMTRADISDWIPIGVAIASLVISLLASFKSELFDFDPVVINSGFALIHSTKPDASNSGVLLPLHFTNNGYGEGAILNIAIRAKNVDRDEVYILTPAMEHDLQKLMQATGRIHSSNILGPFLGFPLGSKQTVSKAISFSWTDDNPSYDKPILDPGEYKFEVLLKVDREEKPITVHTFSHSFDQKTINSFVSGNAIFRMENESWDREM